MYSTQPKSGWAIQLNFFIITELIFLCQQKAVCSCQIMTPFCLCIMNCTSKQLGSHFILKAQCGLQKIYIYIYTQQSFTEILHLFFLFFFSPLLFCSQPKRKVTSSDAIYIVLFMHPPVECLCSKKMEDLQPLVPFTFDVFKKWLKYQYVYWT